MTTTETERRTSEEVLRLVFASGHAANVSELNRTLSGLQSLLVATAHADIAQSRRSEDFTTRDRWGIATLVADNMEIRRLRMNSPLEIVLQLNTVLFGGGALAGIVFSARRILALFMEFQDARIKHAETGVAVDEAHLKRELIALAKRRLQEGTDRDDKHLLQVIEEAAETIGKLEAAEIVPEEDIR